MSELQELSLRITKTPLRQATHRVTVGVTEGFGVYECVTVVIPYRPQSFPHTHVDIVYAYACGRFFVDVFIEIHVFSSLSAMITSITFIITSKKILW